jgi:cysteinyl-tRNA synthetase
LVLKLYNSYGRKKVSFRPVVRGEVKMYTCGPTVWDYAHIGNFRTFVFEDVLRRYLEFLGYKVTQVKNITDVDDRIIQGMKRTRKTREELTEYFTQAFVEDLDTLNLERVEQYPRATQNIAEMVELVKVLLKKGYAYRAEDGSIYYKVRKFRRYGKLSGIRTKDLKAGARVSVDNYEKLAAGDFALWKAWDADDGEVFWETELGKGRPGWHIECSAMSMKYLGESFDIHTGGKDLKFPHHENEIAQSEAATGKKFVRYWVHSGFLEVKGEEMHKHLGNIVTLRDLLRDNIDPMAIRYFLISARHRDELNLTSTALQQSKASLDKIRQLARRLRAVQGTRSSGTLAKHAAKMMTSFRESMDDDLNTPGALASIFTFVKKANSLMDKADVTPTEASGAVSTLEKIDSVLGIMKEKPAAPMVNVEELLRRREEARQRRDYVEADRIREELKSKGIIIEDTPTGTYWHRD